MNLAMGRDTNFYYSFLVLPPQQRKAIVAVWDFCRAVDDAVDEPGLASSASEVSRCVAGWRDGIERVFNSESPQSTQGRTLQPFVRAFELSRQPFDDLVEGVSMDTGNPRYRTFADLREYCYRVASTVGLMCIEIF